MKEHICSTECGHGCSHGIPFEKEKELTEEFNEARRSFLKGAMVLGGSAMAASALTIPLAKNATAQGTGRGPAAIGRGVVNHYYVPAKVETVHWGYFGRSLKPVVEVNSGDYVTMETLTHHCYDDFDRMIKGDSDAEAIFYWDAKKKNINRRGIGPMDHKLGAGGGLGVHIMTGPIAIKGAEPGDILEVRIIDVVPRPSGNPKFKGKTFGSNVAANWGFHYGDCIEEPKKREVVTIYEVDATGERNWARAAYNYRWTPQKDPFGVVHPVVDYPGVPVDHKSIKKNFNILKNIRVPIRPHFGVIGNAPAEIELVNSIPPNYTGGNIDNWRIGKGATIYLPVAVKGANFTVGDPHASQGDSELCGTAIECSLTGTFQLILHKKPKLAGTQIQELDYPLIETQDEWVVHGYSYANYLAELGPDASNEIFKKSSVDKALRDAYHKLRHFLMKTQNLNEDEALSLMSIAADFGITQVVDGNWGVHAIVKKNIFPGRD